jgi:hypothetical protein
MKIINHLDKQIKVTSETLTDVLSNIADYESITIKANKCNEAVVDAIIDLDGYSYHVDANTPVLLGETMYALYFVNIVTGEKFQVLTSTHAMLDVAEMGLQIDAWFATIGISSSVGVNSTSGNIIDITNLPNAYVIPYSFQSGINSSNLTEYLFSVSSLSSHVILSNDAIYINPSLFSDTELEDGVYSVQVIYTKVDDAGYKSETMCSFIDVNTRCEVATLMQELLAGEYKKEVESLWLLHYALTSGSNCGCNCEDLCEAFSQLTTLLNTITTDPNTIITDCGC